MSCTKWMALLGIFALPSCGSLTTSPSDAATRLLQGGNRGPRWLEIEGDRIVAVAVPIAETELPAVISHRIASIQPGGEHTEVERLWANGRQAYRVTTRYAEGTAGRWRQLVLDGDGTVRERSHDLALDAVPEALRHRLAEIWRGTVVRVDAVQRGPREEGYRFHLRARDGGLGTIECTRGGAWSRPRFLLQATLWVAGPAR